MAGLTGGQRLLAYVLSTVLVTVVGTFGGFWLCTGSDSGDTSLCGLAFFACPPVFVGGMLMLCVVIELAVRARERCWRGSS